VLISEGIKLYKNKVSWQKKKIMTDLFQTGKMEVTAASLTTLV
jgi:hypothetical protein